MGISVVICTHNGSKRLKTVMDSLFVQEVPSGFSWEIIVVDNASTDDTSGVAQELLGSQVSVPFKIVVESRPGLAFARARGIEESAYEIIGFVDDDNWVRSDWLRQAAAILASHPDAGVCGGLNEAVFENEPPRWFERFQSSFGTGPQGEEGKITGNQGYVFGAGMILRKKLWNQLAQVFSEFFPQCIGRQGGALSAGDDNEICYAISLLGFQIRYDSRLRLRHFLPDHRLTEHFLFETQKNYGKATVLLDPYLLAESSGIPLVSKLKSRWLWQVIVTLAKLWLFLLLFLSFTILWWFSNARLDARLRIVRHFARLKELFRLRKRYTENVQEVQQRVRRMRAQKAVKSEQNSLSEEAESYRSRF